ncbi:VOC family protein [Kaistia geumhonensis]|uniref:Catechol 2,3-dioxygenase n=1 Tax=Kaistia geumhonensis TaxID=410839 RepID=A0ABU0MBF6_9HYPH|nr:VOC family protein [Kaistia geumhonensis]MCX5481242.1 VOC family protein [Kaistia geumhonensis]MDQ0518303.1 catechol 2,3-dioxygenase [Kaistia geumhonensis]
MADAAPSPTLPFALTRPLHVAAVGLKAKSVPTLASYYRALLGLETIAEKDGHALLGAGGIPFLELSALPPGAALDDPRSAGLFHTAFLMPTRADLGRWVRHAIDRRIPVDGMSDHVVSEAFYLTDPEGNGIEVYADRPEQGWRWSDGKLVDMRTDPLDVDAILESVPAGAAPYASAPEALRIGHVHLRVGNDKLAEDWWTSEIGLDVVARYPGASFLSSGGYHHHIAGNIWRSRGAGPRDPARGGLAYVALSGSGVTAEREVLDPWGTVVQLRKGS